MTWALIDPEAIEALADALAEKVAARLCQQEVEDGWMTSDEAAAYLAVPISTLRKLTAAGSIPFTQDVAGGRCYFKRSELDRWRARSASGLPPGDGLPKEVKCRQGTDREWPRDVAPSGAVAQGGSAP